MRIQLRGQVKNTFYSDEKKKSYITVFDSESSSDVNFTQDGQTELRKGDPIDHLVECESNVYKGQNTLIIKKMEKFTVKEVNK